MRHLVFYTLRLSVLLSCILCAVGTSPLSADLPLPPTIPSPTNVGNRILSLPDVSKMSGQETAEATKRFSNSLTALGRDILVKLKQPGLSSDAKASLYRMAAYLKVYEAMDIMINDIGFVYRGAADASASADDPYGAGGPIAQESLSAFGLPAFREIMDVMSDHKPDVPFVAANTNAYAWVLWAIEGKRCAVIRLQERLAKEKSPKVRAQYRRVMDRLKAYTNTD